MLIYVNNKYFIIIIFIHFVYFFTFNLLIFSFSHADNPSFPQSIYSDVKIRDCFRRCVKTSFSRSLSPQHLTFSSGAQPNLTPGESIPDPATAGSHSPSPLQPDVEQTATKGFE